MKNNQVTHIITTIERGGAETQLLILTREQINQGLKVEVIYLKGEPDLKFSFQELGVRVNESVANKKLTNQIKILRKYFKNYSGVVHSHLPRAEVISFFTVKKKGFIITRHNHEQFWPSVPRLVSSLFSRIIISKSAGGIAISHSLNKYLIRNREISKNFPMKVIYYGFGLQEPISTTNLGYLLRDLNLTKQTFKIGIISRLVPGKDYPTLFKALSEVLVNNQNFILLIVGNGNQKTYLEEMSRDLRIDKHICWLGKIEEVSEFLSSLDLFVFTSRGEGFGLVLLEAMLASKPIIAANNSAIPEVLGEGYSGLFETRNSTELAAKISKVMTSRTYALELTNSYKQQIELFNSGLMSKLVKEVYENYGF